MKANRNMRRPLSTRGPVRRPRTPHAPREAAVPSPLSTRRPRRGVLLLLILALLAMFGLIAIAFVVISGQAQRSAKSVERIDLVSDPPQKTLHQAAMQVFRGPTNNASVMRAHSLLEDIYGNEYLKGTTSTTVVAAPVTAAFKQLVNIPVAGLSKNGLAADTSDIAVPPADLPPELARHIGCVLTITGVTSADAAELALKGQSTRIVATFVNAGVSYVQVVAFPNSAVPPRSTAFTINSTPFSGTGFGYNPTTGELDLRAEYDATNKKWVTSSAATAMRPVAYLPNLPLTTFGYLPTAGASDIVAAHNYRGNPPGGVNEDYDAADFQNMLLAAQVPNPNAPGGIQTLPSLHRAALCRYWAALPAAQGGLGIPAADFTTSATTLATAATTFSTNNLELLRAITLRPLPTDHPSFTGSNPAYKPGDAAYVSGFNPLWDGLATIAGPPVVPAPFSWDVDNDGDGTPDSVWVDLGMPVRSTADGRLYKPLYAILCVDMDGRLNLNAHGSQAQADAANYTTFVSRAGNSLAAGTILPADRLRGQGFGPADINLSYVVGGNATLHTQLFGGISSGYNGRYGNSTTGVPGDAGLDPLSMNTWFEYGQGANYGANYWHFITAPASATFNDAGSYGSPPDPFGAGVLGLDQAGRPVYAGFNYNADATKYVGYGSAVADNPYETNLASAAKGASGSNLFSVAELERSLRPFDRDAALLPARLASLTSTDATNHNPADSVLVTTLNLRKSFTTESWDLPCPNLAMPGHILGSATAPNTVLFDLNDAAVLESQKEEIRKWCPPRSMVDLLRAKSYVSLRSGGANVATALTQSQTFVTNNAPVLLPSDLLAGLKMNINRPFGNGLDETVAPNNVVDDPAETCAQTTAFGKGGSAASVSFDGKAVAAGSPATALEARQLEARYLYVLAMLLSDTNAIQTQLGVGAGPTDVARYLAQWAVNVVDFKDRDSIMTPFIYDPTPFSGTGWNTTTYHLGPPTATDSANVVWGCERPELLITETLAFHDRRTEDTPDEIFVSTEGAETDKGRVTDAAPNKDSSYDQTFRPQGSLFVELYNPKSALEPNSGDLTGPTVTDGLDLAKSVGGSPVWRLAIAIPTANIEQPDPDDPDPAAPDPTIEREVYFVPEATATVLPTTDVPDVRFYASSATGTVPVAPGGYAVIGPGETGSTTQHTYIGFCTGKAAGDNDTRYIDLSTSPVPGSTSALALPIVHNNTNAPAPVEPTTANANLPTVLAVDTPRRLSVSEPADGYETGKDRNGDSFEPSAPDTTTKKYPTPYDIPFDSPLRRDDGGQVLQSNGTYPQYRVVYLQRLANPLLPYNVDSNPYRTIDMMAIDVTAFNGVCSDASDPQAGAAQTGKLDTHFQSRQRGERNDDYSVATRLNLWKQEPVAKTEANFTALVDAPDLAATIDPHYFARGLKHSLGYLNQRFGAPVALTNTVLTAGTELGMPANPFPWLTWNNRPYVNPLELLTVPTCRSSKLLVNASDGTPPNDASNANYNRYFNVLKSTDAAVNPYSTATLSGVNIPYPHLMNFFQSDASNTTTTTQFHRILEFLGVPSPYAGADVWANPATIVDTDVHNFHPPFNRISTYREPGRINLNTIYTTQVYSGLMNGVLTPAWNTFQTSRRGYAGGDILDIDPTNPTQFARPFRSFGGWTLTPAAVKPAGDVEISSTLLRPEAGTNDPLFKPAAYSADASNDMYRNPYFRYQNLMRLGNLVTTRSNVYGVWITVGYFEVTPWGAVDAAHPDGYQLRQELGLDSGEVQRHRAFYMFDRTIPVGFQRGQDLNVEKAILLNRFIE